MDMNEKLESLVQEAIENGWDSSTLPSGDYINSMDHHHEELIFNHDFAKALFGEGVSDFNNTPMFEYQLMRAVVSPDPIDYMYDVIFNK